MTTKPHHRTGRPLALLGTLLAAGSLAAGIAGCGGGDETQSSSASATPPKADTVSIEDFEFMPATIEVTAGTKLTFSNDDTAGHTATGDTFDTGSIPKGQKKTVTLKQTGTFPYICNFHPFMKGTVVVK